MRNQTNRLLRVSLLPALDQNFLNMLLLFAAVGFLAQLVDGALGMAYGVLSTTVLLAFGVPPAAASASVHTAEVFTTGASGTSHILHKNIEWRLFLILAPAGIVGGIAGAYLLAGIDGEVIRPFITVYLGLIGVYMLIRAFGSVPTRRISGWFALPLGGVGGFIDAIGGGGWGPVVTSSLIGAGGAPRYVIGTVNTAEFLVTVAISTTFIVALISGHWQDALPAGNYAGAVAGLVVGGLCAAPLAGWVVRIAPRRVLTILVGLLVVSLSAYQAWQIWG